MFDVTEPIHWLEECDEWLWVGWCHSDSQLGRIAAQVLGEAWFFPEKWGAGGCNSGCTSFFHCQFFRSLPRGSSLAALRQWELLQAEVLGTPESFLWNGQFCQSPGEALSWGLKPIMEDYSFSFQAGMFTVEPELWLSLLMLQLHLLQGKKALI